MRASILSAAFVAVVVSAQSSSPSASPTAANAPVVSTNPIGASYIVQLPEKEGSTIRGSVLASSSPDGTGILFQVSISGLPAEGGPFLYHIHEKPVPTNGNCTGTGAHLDPYKRGETPPCDPTNPAQCQTGDLSGKHGKIPGTSYSNGYTDLYSSTDPTNPAYFGNLSIVVHLANKTRIACANFTTIATGYATSLVPVSPSSASSQSPVASSGYTIPTSSGNATLSPSSTASGKTGATATPPSPSLPVSTGSASKLAVGAGALIGGALMMLL